MSSELKLMAKIAELNEKGISIKFYQFENTYIFDLVKFDNGLIFTNKTVIDEFKNIYLLLREAELRLNKTVDESYSSY